jgi:hypothetical protein
MGSEFYAANPTVPLAQIDVAIALDLTGAELWPGFKGHAIFGTETSPEVRAVIDGITVPSEIDPLISGLHLFEELVTGGHLPLSDYDAFRNRDVPVVFLSDGTNKTYHTPNDDAVGIAGDKLEAEAKLLVRLTFALGQSPTTPTFDDQGLDALTDARTLSSLLAAATRSDGIVSSLGLSATSANNIASDQTAVNAVKDKLEGGGTANGSDIATLRGALQRVQCLAGSSYSEFICNAF